MRSWSLVRSLMKDPQRVLTYTELPAEGDRVKTTDPHSSWPSKGLIKFHNVKMSYRPGLPLVLKGVDFEIRPREKIGIIGRTGAGMRRITNHCAYQ
jgi:ATP-binding cassette subfamily C (CFTR/MRP) protein 1